MSETLKEPTGIPPTREHAGGDGCYCDRCGQSGEGMLMYEAIEAGWWFTPPTSLPDAPDAYCPTCARFLQWSVAKEIDMSGALPPALPRQACGTCGRATIYAALHAGICVECLFSAALGDRRRAQTLAEGSRKLLGKACALFDGNDGWYWGCRHCAKLGPVVGLKTDARVEDIPHKPDCVVPKMEKLVTPQVTPL